MARLLRIEYAHGLYHITARGNARMDIFLNDTHRGRFLEILSRTCERHNGLCHAYCLVGNHYHLLVETIDPTLWKGMKYLNGTYSQYFNRSIHRVGHVFQGRYKSVIVDKDSYLLELSRYLALNPVRAGMVSHLEDWKWSSYRGAIGLEVAHPCVDSRWLLGLFGKSRAVAQRRYKAFVAKEGSDSSPLENVKNQIYLGSDEFITKVQTCIRSDQSVDDIPKPQRYAAPNRLKSMFLTTVIKRKVWCSLTCLDTSP
jgi:putative transposase